MEKLFILGTTKYAFMLRKMIEQEKQFDIVGHTVSKFQFNSNKPLCDAEGVKLYPFEELWNYVKTDENINVLNAIGYTNMNNTRQKLYNECVSNGYVPINYISNRAIVLSKIAGQGNIVFPGAYIGTNVEIGNNNVFYAGCVMTHDIKIANNNFIAASVTCGGEVQIGSNCFIGMGAVIRNRIIIADYSLIGASAYLDHSTKEKDVVVPPKCVTLEKNSFEVSLTPKKR